MGFLHGRKPGLLAQFALMSLLPIVALGFVLARDLRRDARRDALREARRVTQTAGNLALGQILAPSDVRDGIDPRKIAPLDRALHRDLSGVQVVRIKVWSPKGEVVYSDDKGLIGRSFPLSDELSAALVGGVSSDVSDLNSAETRRDRRFGRLLEVYAPLRLGGRGRPEGAFELYTPYAPVAARASAEGRHVALLLLAGLGALWLCLFRIAAGASRRLRRQAAENERLALHDPVTDLPNRTLFRDRVRQALLAAERDRGVAAVLLMDIDRFKDVNDTLGHPNGDRLLRDIGVRLGAALRASDTIARLGGDEFAVLLPRIGGAAGAVEVSEKLLAALEAPFTIRDLSIHVEASLGIALFPEHGTDTDALIQHADIAMYAAKRSRTRLELYSPETGDDDPRQLVLLGELRRALESDELVLHYQPKIDLRTGGVAGVEALVRWCHPTRGMLAPADFVPLAERTGLVRRLSARVLHLALADARVWRDQGVDLEIAVNLSVANLIDPRLLDDVAGALAESRIPPARLKLEITESVFMDDPIRARAVLRRLSAMGVLLSIDDYGTGHSSLAYLQRLPVGELKIDRSFVTDMDSDKGKDVIVRSTIELASNLGLRVVAEGVETAAVQARLIGLGCHLAQGFHFARPMPPERLPAWVRAHGVPSALAA